MLYTNQATCPAYSTFLDIIILTESKQQCTRKHSKYWVSFILFTQFHSFQDVRADGNHGTLFSICVLCDSFGGVILERQRERDRALLLNPLKPSVSSLPKVQRSKNSTCCSHSLFIRLVWISEQTAVISLHTINWLIFITEKGSVYCAVLTRYLNIIQANLSL